MTLLMPNIPFLTLATPFLEAGKSFSSPAHS
jgi:hypothetical protein